MAQREIERLENLVAENPFNRDLRMQLASYYIEEGEYSKAEQQADTLLEQDDEFEMAYMVLGAVYLQQGRYEDALQPYLQVVALNEDNPMRGLNKQFQHAQYQLGVIYIELGQPQDAIEPLKATSVAMSTDADSRYLLGVAYSDMGECEEAVEWLKQAIRFVPNYLEAYEELAYCYGQMGDTNTAAYARGMVHYCHQRYTEAVASLEEAVAADPAFVEARLGLGLAYEELGQLQNAADQYEAVVELDPENNLAGARLNQLRDR